MYTYIYITLFWGGTLLTGGSLTAGRGYFPINSYYFLQFNVISYQSLLPHAWQPRSGHHQDFCLENYCLSSGQKWSMFFIRKKHFPQENKLFLMKSMCFLMKNMFFLWYLCFPHINPDEKTIMTKNMLFPNHAFLMTKTVFPIVLVCPRQAGSHDLAYLKVARGWRWEPAWLG